MRREIGTERARYDELMAKKALLGLRLETHLQRELKDLEEKLKFSTGKPMSTKKKKKLQKQKSTIDNGMHQTASA